MSSHASSAAAVMTRASWLETSSLASSAFGSARNQRWAVARREATFSSRPRMSCVVPTTSCQWLTISPRSMEPSPSMTPICSAAPSNSPVAWPRRSSAARCCASTPSSSASTSTSSCRSAPVSDCFTTSTRASCCEVSPPSQPRMGATAASGIMPSSSGVSSMANSGAAPSPSSTSILAKSEPTSCALPGGHRLMTTPRNSSRAAALFSSSQGTASA